MNDSNVGGAFIVQFVDVFPIQFKNILFYQPQTMQTTNKSQVKWFSSDSLICQESERNAGRMTTALSCWIGTCVAV